MAQKLTLPIDNCKLNCGYKMQKYQQEWKFPHYGVDMAEVNGNQMVRASGNGTVIASGMDGNKPNELRGNAIVIVYPDVLLPSGKVTGLACRMFHFDSLLCKAGDKVVEGTPIGYYGNTGAYTSGAHLHIEFDTDTDAPAYAYGLGQGGKVIKKGSIDSTVDPCKVFWLGDWQSITAPEEWILGGWIDRDSLNIPCQSGDDVAELRHKVEQLSVQLKNAESKNADMTIALTAVFRKGMDILNGREGT